MHRVLKNNGKFLFLFFSSDSCNKAKNIFYNIFKSKSQNMFMPVPDILLLGNITSSMGYKNVVVDKSNFIITNSEPKHIWFFVRDLGLSNYLQNRNRNFISKYNYNRLCETIKLLLTDNGKITNQISINYLIGTKKISFYNRHLSLYIFLLNHRSKLCFSHSLIISQFA